MCRWIKESMLSCNINRRDMHVKCLVKSTVVRLYLWIISWYHTGATIIHVFAFEKMLGIIPLMWLVLLLRIHGVDFMNDALSFNITCSLGLFFIVLLLLYFRYASCATPQDFEIYAENATFEDPLMRANGYVLWTVCHFLNDPMISHFLCVIVQDKAD